MAISYAAVRNHHAKVTMPTVESGWYTSSNIQKDPPKSINTRRKDKVGDTMATTIMIGDAPDRQCESINYYARGVNPMVSVDYGQGQSSGTQAFLPYRIARDGAFRAPVLSGTTNLLPLSRLPRILTTVCATPYQPIFTKRMRDCVTNENTREIKTDMLRASCVAQKAIQSDPDLNQPITNLQIRDDLVCENVRAQPSCPTNYEEIRQRLNQPKMCLTLNKPYANVTSNAISHAKERDMFFENYDNIELTQNKPNTTANTYPSIQREQPFEHYDIKLNPNRPNTTAIAQPSINREQTVMFDNHDNIVLTPNRPNTIANSHLSIQREQPVVFNNINLTTNRPNTQASTNSFAPGAGFNQNQEFKRLQPRPQLGGFEGYAQIPKMIDNPVVHLNR